MITIYTTTNQFWEIFWKDIKEKIKILLCMEAAMVKLVISKHIVKEINQLFRRISNRELIIFISKYFLILFL